MTNGSLLRGRQARALPKGLCAAIASALAALLIGAAACARQGAEGADRVRRPATLVVSSATRPPDPSEGAPPTTACPSPDPTSTPRRTPTRLGAPEVGGDENQASTGATPRSADWAESTSTPVASPSATFRSPAVDPATAPPRSVGAVAVWEGQITLNTYDWWRALVPTEPDDPVYPYPRLDFDRVGPPAPRAYGAVFLQNDYVQLTIVPELGGRILGWVDRTTGRQLFYANPVIRPTRWGARGWWLATGGMEWAFPVEEHGLNEYRAWEYELVWNGVRVWDTDDRTGLDVEVTIWLDRDRSHFSVAPRITNRTADVQPYQFWSNAMLALSDRNAPSPDLRFIMPAHAATVHTTGDSSLPGSGSSMSWPVHDGRDFSRYSEWRKPLGLFARPPTAGFVGAYDPSTDQGVVRVFPFAAVSGVKIFCLGDLGPELWTDDGSRYFELWGGITPTFWDYWTLQPGASVLWTEQWYAVSGVGGYDWANDEAAIRLSPSGDQVEVGVATTRALYATVVLLRGGVEAQRWDTRVAPGEPFRATSDPASSGGDWVVQVVEQGIVIAQSSL